MVACLVAVAGAAGQPAEAVQAPGLADPDAEVTELLKGLRQAVQRGVEVPRQLEGQAEVAEDGRMERVLFATGTGAWMYQAEVRALLRRLSRAADFPPELA